MDVHKETIDVAVAEGGRQGEVRHYGVIAPDVEALDRVVRALQAPSRVLHFVYEAGPCGFGMHRHLTGRGLDCAVVSPSMVPKRSGDRVKTDRRDSVTLARLHRAGELRAIHIPDATDEAMRDLARAREDAVVVGTQAKYRLKAFLLRQGRRYPGRAGWTRPYRRWLADLSFLSAAQHITLQEYRDAIDETERRLERLTEQLRQLAPTWRWAPLVAALQALRGVSFITAMGLVAELGDLTRFGQPRELMAFLGLVPEARVDAGFLLRRVQRGESLGLPVSRAMPSIGARCHELRIGDRDQTWRIVYHVASDAIVILDVFSKKTAATPRAVIANCGRRLQEYLRLTQKKGGTPRAKE